MRRRPPRSLLATAAAAGAATLLLLDSATYVVAAPTPAPPIPTDDADRRLQQPRDAPHPRHGAPRRESLRRDADADAYGLLLKGADDDLDLEERRLPEGDIKFFDDPDIGDVDGNHAALPHYATRSSQTVEFFAGLGDEYELTVYDAGMLNVGAPGDDSTTPGKRGARPPPGLGPEKKKAWWRRHKRIMGRKRLQRAAAAAAAERPSGGGTEQDTTYDGVNLEIIILQDPVTIYETFDMDIEVLCAQNAGGSLTDAKRTSIEKAILNHLQRQAECDDDNDAQYEYVSLIEFYDSDCCQEFGGNEEDVATTCTEGADPDGRNLQESSLTNDATIAGTTTGVKKKTRRRRSKARLKRKYRCKRCKTTRGDVLVEDSIGRLPDAELPSPASRFLQDVVEPLTVRRQQPQTFLRSSFAAPRDAASEEREDPHDDSQGRRQLQQGKGQGPKCPAPTLVEALNKEGLNAVSESEITAVYRHNCAPQTLACTGPDGVCCSAPGCSCSPSGVSAEMCDQAGCVLPQPLVGLTPPSGSDNLCCAAPDDGALTWPGNRKAFPGTCRADVCGNDECALQPFVETTPGGGTREKRVNVDVELLDVCDKDGLSDLDKNMADVFRNAIRDGGCGGSIRLKWCVQRDFLNSRRCGGGGKEYDDDILSLVTLRCNFECSGRHCITEPQKPLGPFRWE